MSTSKRRGSGSGTATQNDGEHQPASSRNKRRLSSTRQLGEDETRPKRVQGNGYKPNSVPMQPFRRHHDAHLVSEGARPPNRNKRASFRRPPEWFDVSPGLRDAVPPADDDMYPWRDEHIAFIKSASGLDHLHWIGIRPLGSGGFGTAGLWERRDENNVLIEQIVVKESKTASVASWKGEVPEEVKMMRRMNYTNCQAVPELKAYRRYVHVRKHRMYMEFCPYHDLAALNLNYKRFRAYFPEPFLWYTFGNLVKVAAKMENGRKPGDWDYQIVHRDLKPANIFLGLEDGRNGFRMYPVAKTGDWGLATKIQPGDHRNPIVLRGAGTHEYLAPEQRLPNPNDNTIAQAGRQLYGKIPLQKLSAKTNVWGIGAIMFELLTHEAVHYYRRNKEWTINEVFQDIPNARTPKYSDALTELIRLCLMPDSWDRPSVEELDLKIGARCQSITDAYAANPSLRQKDRLYYKGSEINQMPAGGWHYWVPVIGDVPHPSDPPDPQEIINPFTASIEYPEFPSSELSDSEEEGGRQGDIRGEDRHEPRLGENNVEDDRASKGQRGDSVGRPIVISDGPPGIFSGEGTINSNDVSDSSNSETRRRMAIKKLPGT